LRLDGKYEVGGGGIGRRGVKMTSVTMVERRREREGRWRRGVGGGGLVGTKGEAETGKCRSDCLMTGTGTRGWDEVRNIDKSRGLVFTQVRWGLVFMF
jgi:hypothetical protein